MALHKLIIEAIQEFDINYKMQKGVITNKKKTESEIKELQIILSSHRKKREILFEDVLKVRFTIKAYLIKLQRRNNRINNKPRLEASKHTSKKEVREAVFKLHGEKCLKCNSKDNIQIDHVIPVFHGGKNEIENYQPLCKSCNTSKGTKVIDYRK